MLQIRKGGYKKQDIEDLHFILCSGLSAFKQKCSLDCTVCCDRKPCDDVQKAIIYLEHLVNNRKKDHS